MAIVPDTKNWTWVLERECPECRFDSSTTSAGAVAELTRANVARWPAVLSRVDVGVRPDTETWSALEYGAHVRDVFRLFRIRLALMLAEDDPRFADWNQDSTAVEERYSEQDPQLVAEELVEAGLALADDIDAIPADAWQRTGRRGDGSAFTVDTLMRYYIHDPTHHLHDVGADVGA
ncbi:DinB family protein [soil metagenome]